MREGFEDYIQENVEKKKYDRVMPLNMGVVFCLEFKWTLERAQSAFYDLKVEIERLHVQIIIGIKDNLFIH